MEKTCDIVIIGGGATGVAALTAYSARHPSGRIALVDPEEIGFGPAFGFADPILLTNTPVGVMSLDANDPHDFERYLNGRGWGFDSDSFVPRYLVAQYCRERYLGIRETARKAGGEVLHVKGRCQGLTHDVGCGSAPIGVRIEDGRTLYARGVVLAMGLNRRRSGVAGSPPGEGTAVAATTSGGGRRQVLVLGTKLSAIDAALIALAAGDHVIMCSPSGMLPAVRTRLRSAPAPPRGHGAGIVPGVPVPTDADPETRLAEEVALAEADQVPWQDLVGPFIDEMNISARRWSTADIVGFRTDHAHLLSRYVSAMPLHNARILLAAMRDRRLGVYRGVPRDLTRSDSGWRSTWAVGPAETYDAVVNATGFLPPALPTVEAGSGGSSLVFGTANTDNDAVVRLDPDLRMRVGATAWPVWTIGSAAHTRTPIVNYLRTAVLQAAEVSESITHVTTGRKTYAPAAG